MTIVFAATDNSPIVPLAPTGTDAPIHRPITPRAYARREPCESLMIIHPGVADACEETMQTFRTAVHLCFDAATALLYTASIAIALAAAAFIFTQMLAFGLLIALISFIFVAFIWGRRIWRRYHPRTLNGNSPVFAH